MLPLRHVSEQPKIRDSVVNIAFCFCGWLMWRFVEQPFRNRHRHVRTPLYFASLLGVVALCLALTTIGAWYNSRVWDNSATLSAIAQASKIGSANFTNNNCFIRSPDQKLASECLTPKSDKEHSALLIGDSHAANLLFSLQSPDSRFSLLQATATGCRPLWLEQAKSNCDLFFSDIFNRISEGKIPSVHTVILAGHWANSEVESIAETVNKLSPHVERVILIGPRHEYRVPLPIALGIKERFGIDVAAATLKDDRFVLDTQLQSRISSDIGYVSMIQLFCK